MNSQEHARSRRQIIYEMIMFLLALMSVSFIWIEDAGTVGMWVDRAVWFIFAADYFTRLFRSDMKWSYIKRHPFELIAIIPLDELFRFARLARLFRLIRGVLIVSHYSKTFFLILRTNGMEKVLAFAVGLIFVASIPIYMIEPTIDNYHDALWWSIVTATTVGYGDLSPETALGRVIAVILMLFGIGLIGMVTASIATYFIGQDKEKEENSEYNFVKAKLEEYPGWSDADYELLTSALAKMKADADAKAADAKRTDMAAVKTADGAKQSPAGHSAASRHNSPPPSA
ncbi:potassium channel family protein [Paenibacillus sp. J5C_2022]|uniref:potassium channel family protein n=1 Tax=Paenibacillus sp. J5C2022 TaxID=2977129 RepID=UPI0021D30AC8|nr:potassium channel family protein [Paenibacillus sp. J5C2022]MCU6713068.1 potassium channel family protein [Paenibacillus sp. J5C2022]